MSSPFNQEKYDILLKGLEISEIKLSDIKKDNRTFRIDSNYFIKHLVSLEKEIKTNKHFFIPEDNIVSGPFGSSLKSDAYLSAGIPFIRIENIKNGFSISKEKMIYISAEDNARLKSSQLKTNDLVLSKVGNTIGYYARVDEDIKQCNISENNIGIKLDNFSTARKHYILTYLNSSIGKSLTLRRISGNAQPKLNVFDVSDIPIPEFEESFEQKISKLIVESYNLLVESDYYYSKALNILSSELGLDTWIPSKESTNIKSLKQSFYTSGRLDAEYYQPKYDDLFSLLANYECSTIDKIAHLKKSVEPGSDAYCDNGIPFVRVSDITKYGIDVPDIYLSPTEYSLEKLRPHKDTILLSKDGSIGIAYKVREDMDCITSGALLHLNVFNEDFDPDYLTLVLNSIIVQMQAERDSNGAIIQHWKPSDIEKVVIPRLPKPIQKNIASKIQECFRLKADSKNLLEKAIFIVEKEIEK